jgi:hypothetical protein
MAVGTSLFNANDTPHFPRRRPDHDIDVTFITPDNAVAALLVAQQRIYARRDAVEPLSPATLEFASALSHVSAVVCV